jgi:hypothetical protein
VQRRRALIAVLEQSVPQSSYAETIARLRCFRGINTLTAAGLCAEVGNFERFAKPGLLSGFLGIVPSEYTSNTKRVQGAITKAGPTHARRPVGRGRTPLPPCASRQHRTRCPSRRAGSPRRAGRMARSAAPALPLGASRRRARQADGDSRGRVRTRARCVLLGGSDPELNRTERHPHPRSRTAAGARTSTRGPPTSPSTGPRTRAMGNPATRPGRARS